MRYLLQEQKNPDAIKGRLYFLYECFGIWFTVTKRHRGMLYLSSIPASFQSETIIILAHEDVVERTLQVEQISESRVVLIACARECNFRKLVGRDKQLYITKLVNGFANAYNGRDYGFECEEVYDSEIRFYNLRKQYPFEQAIAMSYDQLR